MSAAHETPSPVTPGGGLSAESAPRVVVCAGKTFVCSACGTLVEIPADVVGQLVVAVGQSPLDEAVQVEPAKAESATPMSPSSKQVAAEAAVSLAKPKKGRPPRPCCPKQPESVSYPYEMIDGLRVPTGKQLDRALKWISFHLKVLDRQGSEANRLRKLLKARSADQLPCLRGHVLAVHQSPDEPRSVRVPSSQVHADVDLAPASDETQERGPP